jgi:hypothetical protein
MPADLRSGLDDRPGKNDCSLANFHVRRNVGVGMDYSAPPNQACEAMRDCGTHTVVTYRNNRETNLETPKRLGADGRADGHAGHVATVQAFVIVQSSEHDVTTLRPNRIDKHPGVAAGAK